MQLKAIDQNENCENYLSGLKPFETLSVLLNGSYFATGKFLEHNVVEALVLDNSEVADLLRTGAKLPLEIDLGHGEMLKAWATADMSGNGILQNNRKILFVRLDLVEIQKNHQFHEETNFRT